VNMHKKLIFERIAALRGTRNPHVLHISTICTLGFCVPCALHSISKFNFSRLLKNE
jgi:hypothetical protein